MRNSSANYVRCRHGYLIACVQCERETRRMRGLGDDFIVTDERLGELVEAANSLGALPWNESPWVALPPPPSEGKPEKPE